MAKEASKSCREDAGMPGVSPVNTGDPDLEYAFYLAERRVLEIQAKLHRWARDDPHCRFVLAAALSAHRSAAFDVHVLAGSGCGAAEVAGSGFAVVVAGEEAGERADEVE